MNIENLKKARENNHLTQAQAAAKLGVSDGTYKNYEQGKREPSNELLCKIADLFGVTADYLLGREPLPNPFADFDLSEEAEKEVIEKYMSFPPEIRACTLDVLRKLGGVIKDYESADENENQKNDVKYVMQAARDGNPPGLVETTDEEDEKLLATPLLDMEL